MKNKHAYMLTEGLFLSELSNKNESVQIIVLSFLDIICLRLSVPK